MKILAGIFGGLILATVGATLVTITFAASGISGALYGAVAFVVLWILAVIIALGAKSGGKAWRYLLISSGIMCLLLPLSGIIFTGTFMAKTIDPNNTYAGAQAAGAAIGGTLLSGFLGFVGFFAGIVLLLTGFLVGREKQIMYVPAPPQPNHPTAPPS